MHLAFDVPAGWTTERRRDVTTVQSGPFGARIEGVLAGGDVDPRALFEAGAPPGATIAYLQIAEDLISKAGWRMKLATLEVRDVRGRRSELRLGAIYEMLHFRGIAVATSVSDEDRPVLLEVLASARAQLWPDEAVCIAELWSTEEP